MAIHIRRPKVSGSSSFSTLARRLLEDARRLIEQGHPGPAVVVAHTACEVRAEQAMARFFEKRGLASLQEAMRPEYGPDGNLAKKQARRFYSALTGDLIEAKVRHWSRFEESRKLRNKVVHRGEIATGEDARRACAAVEEVLNHLDAVLAQR
jgi:hypothetical protein